MSSQHWKDILPGPWQVRMTRINGETYYQVLSHTHAAIAVDREGYWDDDHEPTQDVDGYFQPDAEMEVMPYRVGVAFLIAAAPELLAMLERIHRQQGFCSVCIGYYAGGEFLHAEDCEFTALLSRARGEVRHGE